MSISPPPGQGPIDPGPAFSPPPPPDRPGMMPPPRPGFAPPGFNPPPMMPPPWFGAPPPRRGYFGWIFKSFLVLALLISIGFNLWQALNGSGSSGVRETTIVSGDSTQKIAVVPIVNNMMLEAQADLLDKMLDAAEKDSTIKAIVVKIDTPGGAVTAADEMYHRLEMFKTRRPKIPVIVSMGGYATSGGYYAACAGDYLFAQPTTITGNIGVLLPMYNISKLAEKYGVEDTTIHSTGATYKEAGSWTKPLTPAESVYLQGLIDSAFVQFKLVVSTGRTGKLTAPIDAIANGKAYTADDALKLGLVDKVGYLPDALAYAATKAGISNAQVIRYDEPATILELLSSRSLLPSPSASGSLQINGIQIDAGKIDQLLTPRLLYMWRGS